jgi:hypothetical protein
VDPSLARPLLCFLEALRGIVGGETMFTSGGAGTTPLLCVSQGYPCSAHRLLSYGRCPPPRGASAFSIRLAAPDSRRRLVVAALYIAVLIGAGVALWRIGRWFVGVIGFHRGFLRLGPLLYYFGPLGVLMLLTCLALWLIARWFGRGGR